jgi:SAM-dependent MidA family methyltransferase
MNPVAERIAEEISKQGAISFARFMEVALYCPVYGYYEKEGDTVGRRGDFYTSVSVGSLFGELLGWQMAEWLEGNGAGRIQIVEAGAHRGELAGDILGWMRVWRPEVFGRVEYWIVEPSERRREWQRRRLREWAGKVQWVTDLAELGRAPQAEGVRRVIFCNELLDALPTHRLGWNAAQRTWFEWGVSLEHGRFVWTRMQPIDCGPWTVDCGLLPDGFTIEACPAAAEWWRQAAQVLDAGRLIAFDYGLTQEEFFFPQRKEGTLRAYHRHQLEPDLLANPGDQDLTAHVNFSATQQAGEAAGLTTEGFYMQAQFLTRIASPIWQGRAAFPEWTSGRTRQFQTLTHPEHLGRALRVLVQKREI